VYSYNSYNNRNECDIIGCSLSQHCARLSAEAKRFTVLLLPLCVPFAVDIW